jgi:hypothetical protein
MAQGSSNSATIAAWNGGETSRERMRDGDPVSAVRVQASAAHATVRIAVVREGKNM